MHTQKGTRPQFYEMHHLKYTPWCSNDVCIPAVIVFVGMHTYEQTSLRAALGSDSVVTAMLFFFFRGKTVSIYVASKGHLEPSAPWKAIEESSSTPSLHMSHSFFLFLCPHNNCWLGWAWSRWTTASPPPTRLLYTNNLCSLKMVQGSRATLAINLPAKQTVAPQKHGLARPGGGGCWEGCEEEVGTPVRLAWNAVAEGKQALALKINHSHSQGRQREPHRGTNTHPLQWEIHTQPNTHILTEQNTHWAMQTIREKFCSLTAVELLKKLTCALSVMMLAFCPWETHKQMCVFRCSVTVAQMDMRWSSLLSVCWNH